MELTKIRGINEKRQQDLNKLGIFDTTDLVGFFPRAYLDFRQKQPLKTAYHNDVVLTCAKVISEPTVRYFKRSGVVKIQCEQEGFYFSIVWFNQPYVASKLKAGEEYLFYGRVRREDGVVSMTNPTFELLDKNFRLKGIVPQYSLKGNLTQKTVRDAVKIAVDLEKPKSLIPFDLQAKYGLGDLYSSYREVHNPTTFQSQELAADRVAVEEYFSLISSFRIIKGSNEQVRTNKYSTSKEQLENFIKTRFSFEFTKGQNDAVSEIYNDMTGSKVMNRLLQGDVGSGKTAVSVCAVFVAVNSGYQVVMLSPTEVLARQNYSVIKSAFCEYNVELLTGSTTLKEKKSIKNALSEGKVNVLVGTHAVLTEDVTFNNLSLCICDEQQRFGVAQRSSLLAKGVTPDVLVMSATPIPRTLSLILFGDLDITTITEKPKNRLPVQTNLVPEHKYSDMLGFIKKEISNGNQAYFVCPKIEGDEEGSIMSVTELYQDISERLQGVRVGLLHGKMKEKEKTSVMTEFKHKNIDLLVSTTVIEVGVDVPDATVMVIYNAERFGLSQLHQLRGRVGRSDKKSYCFLTCGSNGDQALDRLKVLVSNHDGFKISEYDYKLRGSGDFMGTHQSGKQIHDLGNLNYSTSAIYLAKKISDEFFDSGRDISLLKEQAIKRYRKLKDVTLN